MEAKYDQQFLHEAKTGSSSTPVLYAGLAAAVSTVELQWLEH